MRGETRATVGLKVIIAQGEKLRERPVFLYVLLLNVRVWFQTSQLFAMHLHIEAVHFTVVIRDFEVRRVVAEVLRSPKDVRLELYDYAIAL